jgi:hypothetical protein
MKLTLQIQLLPDKERSDKLQATMERFNEACSWLADHFDHADVVGATNIASAARVAVREVAEQLIAQYSDKPHL